MMNQKEAVYTAVVNVTEFNGEGQCLPSKEQKAQISAILIEGFKTNQITLEVAFNDTDLKSYVSGLLSNWLRKDTRLNGGLKYQAKNPGSRAGSSDPQLKAMMTLFSTLTDESEKKEVMTYIEARKAELNVAKVKVIDYSALPADLIAKFKK